MNDKLANFFQDFNLHLSSDLGSRFDYPKLLAYLKRKKEILTLDNEFDSLEWIDEISEVIEKAKTIVSTVNEKINPEEDFKDSEYNSHEDRFIVFFIDQAATLLARVSEQYVSSIKTIGGYYVDRQFSLNEASRLNNLRILTFKNNKLLVTQRKLFQLREAITNLTQTNYYSFLKEIPFDAEEDVYTNGVLAVDPLYNACFEYYDKLKALLSTHKIESHPTINLDYHSYALISLLLTLDEKGFVNSGNGIEFDNKNLFLKVKNLKLVRNGLSVIITSESDDHIDLLFEDNSGYSRVIKAQKQSKVSFDIFPCLNSEILSKEEASLYFEKKVEARLNEGYQNAFVISGIKDSENSVATVLLPTSQLFDVNLSSMIDSCLLYLPGDRFTYSHVCPVCGAHIAGEDGNGNYICERCNSEYTLLSLEDKKEKKEIVWVKRLKNLEGE